MFNVMKKSPLLFAGESTFRETLPPKQNKANTKDRRERICTPVRVKMIKY
jgi:hypothetical protein